MGRPQKYAPDISFEDVSTYVREHTRSTGYRPDIVLCAGTGPGGADYVEVRLFPVDEPSSQQATIVQRGAFPSKRVLSQMSAVLHCVAQAYAQLDHSPWLWSAQKRREARGE